MGATLGSGTFEVPRTEAGACTECRVGYKAPRPESGVDYWLDIVYRLKEDKPYALRGFEAGRYQFALPAAAPVRAAAARSAVVSRTERSVTLTAGSVTATVDAATGYLSGYAVRGCELMRRTGSWPFRTTCGSQTRFPNRGASVCRLCGAGCWTDMSTAAAVPERIMPTVRKAPCSGFTPAIRLISVPPISIRRSAATAATSAGSR